MVRAIRGAATAAANTKEDIFNASEELVQRMISENEVPHEDIADILFTVTPDLTAAFPAAAVRRMGITDIPLLDMAAPDIDGALKMCIRVMMHINTDKPNTQLHHIYLGGAEILRPDLRRRGKRISVAIDGPAGAGKSSVAKRVAREAGYVYIDTGAMYRTIGVYAIESGIDPAAEPDKISVRLDEIRININYENGIQHMYLNGRDVTERIREKDASMAASAVAAIPAVRARLVKMQQDMAATGGVIVDGRDICTTVLPNAELKIYLTASIEARAERRYKEYLEKGIECELSEIMRDVKERDYNDMNRAVSPLKKAEDAVLLDTSDMDLEQSVKVLLDMLRAVENRG